MDENMPRRKQPARATKAAPSKAQPMSSSPLAPKTPKKKSTQTTSEAQSNHAPMAPTSASPKQIMNIVGKEISLLPPDLKDFLLKHSYYGMEKRGTLEQYHETIKDNIDACINGPDYKEAPKALVQENDMAWEQNETIMELRNNAKR